jgi:hypothetical protein
MPTTNDVTWENVTKVLTYTLPDKLYSTEATLGKTSTQEYNGPNALVLYVHKESGSIFETWWPEDEPYERPRDDSIERVVFYPETDEDYIKIAIIHGGLGELKIYEVAVGPDDQENSTLRDPSDLRMVYDEGGVEKDYTAPLGFKLPDRERDDNFIRTLRNNFLIESDRKVAPDMPEAVKQQWLDYRQKLRDLPKDWADCPNWLIRFPTAPDEIDVEFDDPNVYVIKISDRSDDDADAIRQLPDGVN